MSQEDKESRVDVRKKQTSSLILWQGFLIFWGSFYDYEDYEN